MYKKKMKLQLTKKWEKKEISTTQKSNISTIMCYGFQFRWLISNWVRERETRKMHPSTCCIRRKKIVSLELHHCGCKWSKSPPDQRAPTTFSWQFAIFLFINCLSDAAALLVSLLTVIFFLHFQAGESLAAIKTSVIRTRNQKWLERLRVDWWRGEGRKLHSDYILARRLLRAAGVYFLPCAHYCERRH